MSKKQLPTKTKINQDIPKYTTTYGETVYNAPLKSALAESLFVLLPLMIISLVFAIKGDLPEVPNQAEWAFGATVLSGQSIIKIVLAVSKVQTPRISNAILLITCIIIILLVPSLIILTLMLTLNPIPKGLPEIQILLFVISLLVFFGFHAVLESFQAELEIKGHGKD